MKKKIEVLCSTGAFIGKINNKDYRLIPRYAPIIEADAFEFMMESCYYGKFDDIYNTLHTADIVFKTFHTDKDIGMYLSRYENDDVAVALELFKRNMDFACRMEINFCVLHLWGGEYSDCHVERNEKYLGQMLEYAQKNGITLSVENVPCTTHTPYEDVYLLLKDFPDLKITFDSRFAAFHGQEKLFCEDESLWKNNIRHVHISDISDECVKKRSLRPILHPGEGCAELDIIYKKLRESYSGCVTMESPAFLPDGSYSIDKLNITLRKLKENLNETNG